MISDQDHTVLDQAVTHDTYISMRKVERWSVIENGKALYSDENATMFQHVGKTMDVTVIISDNHKEVSVYVKKITSAIYGVTSLHVDDDEYEDMSGEYRRELFLVIQGDGGYIRQPLEIVTNSKEPVVKESDVDEL